MKPSLFERDHPFNVERESQLVLGRVTDVFPKERMVQVKTFGRGGPLDDHHVAKCQWVSESTHIDGDESTSIPRLGSLAIVAYIAGEPYALGFIAPYPKQGKNIADEEPVNLGEGDKVIRTKGKNRIIVKSNGMIEVHSKETLKRVYYPTNSEIRDLCQNYKLHTNGGFHHWIANSPTTFVSRQEFRTDLLRSFVVVEERGSVDGLILKRTLVGAGLSGSPFTVALPVYSHEVDATGTAVTKVNAPGAPGAEITIEPTGQMTAKNPLCTIVVNPLGQIQAQNQLGTFTMGEDGSFTMASQIATLSQSADGNLTFTNPLIEAAFNADASWKLFNQSTTVEGDPTGKVKIDAAQTKAVFGQGVFEIGGPAMKLMEKMVELIEQMIQAYNVLAQHTHIGNLGYSTAPPTEATDVVQIIGKVNTIKALFNATKGSL